MLTISRAFKRMGDRGGNDLPKVPAFKALYDMGVKFQSNSLAMVTGRPGAYKSGLVMNYVAQMAQLHGLRTLYISGDTNADVAAMRFAGMMSGDHASTIEMNCATGDSARYVEALADLPITYLFASPIEWRRVGYEVEAIIETWNQYPDIIVIDNLLNTEGAEADYSAQMASMQIMSEMVEDMECLLIVTHHATDKSWNAETNAWKPPSRQETKGGMAELPSLMLSVAFDVTNRWLNVAPIKQRSGPSDPTGNSYATLVLDADTTRLYDRLEYAQMLETRLEQR